MAWEDAAQVAFLQRSTGLTGRNLPSRSRTWRNRSPTPWCSASIASLCEAHSSQQLRVKHCNSVYPVTGTFVCVGCCGAPCCGQPGSVSCANPSSPHGDLSACCCKYPAGSRNGGRRTPVLSLRRRSCSYALHMLRSTQTAATPSASVLVLSKSQPPNIVSQSRGQQTPHCALQAATVRSGCLKRALVVPSHRGCGTAPR
ncbi:hypothetical protein PSPO01_10765 [Paraphaeosphaeria sporulosa]